MGKCQNLPRSTVCARKSNLFVAHKETTTMEEESAPGPSFSKRSLVRDISPTEQEFRDIGIVIMKREKCRNLSELSFLRRWKSLILVFPQNCVRISGTISSNHHRY